MNEASDNSGAIIRPPVAWAFAILAGLLIDWFYPLPFVPASLPRVWVGIIVFVLGFALAIWAIRTIRKAGSRIETSLPTTTIVSSGPYGFMRNPVYLGMFLGQTGLAIGLNSLWVLAMLVPFYLVIRYGVVAREEAYLERKFGKTYLDYKSRVRRWI